MTEGSTSEREGLSVGMRLRMVREARGTSLDEAARVTRIGKDYLTALEEDAFDRFPGPAYVKGALRAYAGYLELPADEMVGDYERALNPSRFRCLPPEDNETSPPETLHLPLSRNRWAIPLILLLLVLVMAYLTGERNHAPAPLRPDVPQSAVVPGPVPVQNAATSAAGHTPVRPALRPEAPAELPAEPVAKPAQGIVLRLRVTEDGPLHMTIDGELTQQYDLKAGDLIEWKADRAFTLDLGNAGGVEADFNGKALPHFGESGKPAHVVLKADETSEDQ